MIAPQNRNAATGTLSALDGDRVIYFTEQAEADEGQHRKMRVCRDGEDWWLDAS